MADLTASTAYEWTADDAARHIAIPGEHDDKYSRGVLGLITGSEQYPGAAVLGVEAALHTGVGMVRYLGPARATELVLQRRPEAVTANGRVEAWVLGSGMDPIGRDLRIASLQFEMTLSGEAKDAPEIVRSIEVRPLARPGRTPLVLPVRGPMINYDGHDALAHHRRFDYSFAPLAQMGFKSNFMRYGYDFVPVDAEGEMVQGDPTRNESYVGFGTPVRATGDGVIVALENRQPDSRNFDPSKIPQDPMVLFGNHAVIDHGNGEFSVYGHLKQGSVQVKVGDRVRRGQAIAAIGASGSAFFPHLHYQLQDGPTLSAEGLPSYFDQFHVLHGASAQQLHRATVDTGQIVESIR